MIYEAFQMKVTFRFAANAEQFSDTKSTDERIRIQLANQALLPLPKINYSIDREQRI